MVHNAPANYRNNTSIFFVHATFTFSLDFVFSPSCNVHLGDFSFVLCAISAERFLPHWCIIVHLTSSSGQPRCRVLELASITWYAKTGKNVPPRCVIVIFATKKIVITIFGCLVVKCEIYLPQFSY